jgi:repressor LexA
MGPTLPPTFRDKSKPRGDLTPRQQNILDFVAEFQGEHGFPPSIREIGEFFGIKSTNGVSDHLRALEKKGFLNRSGNLSRCLQVVRDEEDPRPTTRRPLPGETLRAVAPTGTQVRVPILGKVAAGQPLLAVEEAEDTIVIDSFLLGGPGEVFGLRVVGESMIEAGILPGDFLFVRKRSSAQPGDIVVAMIEGEATVKRWFPEGDRIRLQPENRTMQPIYVRAQDFRQCDLLGTVVGIYRKLT